MHSPAERAAVVAAVVLVISAACSSPLPQATNRRSPPPIDASTAPAASTPPTPFRSATAELDEPGRPFDAATLLAAMRDSRRPGGVPDQLETEAIASALAEAIWTIDGEPWTTMAIGASCGTADCSLEVAGLRSGNAGDDVWTFMVNPSNGTVATETAELRSLPEELVSALDLMARRLTEPGTLDGMLLSSARWLPPPDEDRFVLSYRSGGEEGSCAADLTVDAADETLVGQDLTDC